MIKCSKPTAEVYNSQIASTRIYMIKNLRPIAMVSKCSEDTIPMGRGFLNHVDPIGQAVKLIQSLLSRYQVNLELYIFYKQNAQQPCWTYERSCRFFCDEEFDWVIGDNEHNLNEALLQASNDLKMMPRATAPFLALALILGSVYNKHCPPPTKPTFSYYLPAPSSTIGLICQKHHRGSTKLHRGYTETRAILLTNQLAVYRIGRQRYLIEDVC